MYPDNGRAVIDVTEFKNCKGLADLIYNPVKTRLVMDAENARNTRRGRTQNACGAGRQAHASCFSAVKFQTSR